MRGTLAIVLVAGVVVAAGCDSGAVMQCGSTGPCTPGPHHWTAQEIARDVSSVTFPALVAGPDRLAHVSCKINAQQTRAICVGRRKSGEHPHSRVAARVLLRANGTLELLCWPNPSPLCTHLQVSEQRANPVTG